MLEASSGSAAACPAAGPVASGNGGGQSTVKYDTAPLLRLIRQGLATRRETSAKRSREEDVDDEDEVTKVTPHCGDKTDTKKELSSAAENSNGSSSSSPPAVNRPPREPSPFDAHILQPTEKKAVGWIGMKYVDIPLSNFGLVQLLSIKSDKTKWFLGKRCCYLKLGTSLVFTGIVAGADGLMFQFIPDKDQPAEIAWIPQAACYCIPDDLADVRARVRAAILEILKDPLAR